MSIIDSFTSSALGFITSVDLDPDHKQRLTDADKDQIAKILSKGYYIVLTGQEGNMPSLLVSIATYFLTGKWGKYTHCLINVNRHAKTKDEMKFMQAISTGTTLSSFDDVFATCDYVALLTPSHMENNDWTSVIDTVLTYQGVPYDNLFDLSDKTKVDCAELILDALKGIPDFDKDFGHLAKMVQHRGNLVPQMFYYCADFRVRYESTSQRIQKRDKHGK
jgi:hypothetical protein